MVADLTDEALELDRRPTIESVSQVGLGGQCRLDGPDLRAGRLAVAVQPHDPDGRRSAELATV